MTPRHRLLGLAVLCAGLASFSTAFAQDDEDPEPEVSDQGPAQPDPEPEVSDQGPAEAEPAEVSDEPPAEAAEAEPEVTAPTRDVWDRILAISAHVGVDTAFGIAGASLEVSPFRYLMIYAGAGVGRDGARIVGGVQPQFPMGNAALGLMIGVSGGPLDWDSRGIDQAVIHRYWEFAFFFHSALTVEYRWDAGIFGRLGLGFDAQLAPDDANVCTRTIDDSPCGVAGTNLAKPLRGWIGLTVGYALDL